MPKPSNNERIACRYYVWILSRRGGVWRADGRGNPADAGRHSLGTRDRAEARRLLDRLDATIAARRGVPGAQAPEPAAPAGLPLDEGRRLYLAHVGRAKLLGGARASSQKRYRAAFDKFVPFARDRRHLTTWEQVTATTLADYLAHLQSGDYAPRTQYLEGTTLKQAVAWLVAAKHLPGGCRIDLPLGKPRGTDTHCWTEQEVRAIPRPLPRVARVGVARRGPRGADLHRPAHLGVDRAALVGHQLWHRHGDAGRRELLAQGARRPRGPHPQGRARAVVPAPRRAAPGSGGDGAPPGNAARFLAGKVAGGMEEFRERLARVQQGRAEHNYEGEFRERFQPVRQLVLGVVVATVVFPLRPAFDALRGKFRIADPFVQNRPAMFAQRHDGAGVELQRRGADERAEIPD